MYQEVFTIPILNIPIFGYSLMLVLGFFLALQLARFLSKRSGLDAETFVNAGLIALISGIIGARLSHVIENFGDYTRAELTFFQNLFNAINIRSGGLTYYGGFLLAFPITVLYGVYKKMPLRISMDIIAPCLMIGLGFGRVGCFLNGCCYGGTCDLPSPLGVQYPYHSFAYVDEFVHGKLPTAPPEALLETDETTGRTILKTPAQIAKEPALVKLAAQQHSSTVHNAQIYSAITALMLAALLTAYFTLPHIAGRGFALMLMLEGGTRFLLELLRDEPLRFPSLSLTLSMAIGLCLVAGGIVMWVAFGVAGKNDLSARSAALQPA